MKILLYGFQNPFQVPSIRSVLHNMSIEVEEIGFAQRGIPIGTLAKGISVNGTSVKGKSVKGTFSGKSGNPYPPVKMAGARPLPGLGAQTGVPILVFVDFTPEALDAAIDRLKSCPFYVQCAAAVLNPINSRWNMERLQSELTKEKQIDKTGKR